MSFEQEIKFKNIIVYWNPWEWKTILSTMMVAPYTRIYSNVDYFRNWKKLNMRINKIKDLNMITFSPTPWIVIIDEWWVNVNSRLSLSKENIEFGELVFLWRKINCYFVWISQRFKSMDLNQRDLADLVIKMYKISRYDKHPLFIATREKMIKNRLTFDAEWKVDIISWLKYTKRSYNTLESSKIR